MPSEEPPTRPNPLRNEADAFRVLVAFVIGAAAVVVAAALAGSAVAAALALVLIVIGAWRGFNWLSEGRARG